jgi:hypothetical protein
MYFVLPDLKQIVNLTDCRVVFSVNYRARNVGKVGQKVQ